jgi:hypothetical protein
MTKTVKAIGVTWFKGGPVVKGPTVAQFARGMIARKEGACVLAAAQSGILTDGRVMMTVDDAGRAAAAKVAARGIPAKKMGTRSPERMASMAANFMRDYDTISYRNGVLLSEPTHSCIWSNGQDGDENSYLYVTGANGEDVGAVLKTDEYALVRRQHPAAEFRYVKRLGTVVLAFAGGRLVGALMPCVLAVPSSDNVAP